MSVADKNAASAADAAVVENNDHKAMASSLIRPADIRAWWDTMFRYGSMVAGDNQIELRKIGTSPDGEIFQESLSYQPWIEENPDEAAVQWLTRKIIHAVEHCVGAFMCPGILDDRRANDQSVKYLMGVTVDLDTGDTIQKMKDIISHGLKPTLIVASGGTTKEGNPKLHLHYRLDEPCDEPWKVAVVRDVIANKFGGDGSFKRIPQVVRIPGSVHDKDRKNPRPVQIVECNSDNEYSLSDFIDCFGIELDAMRRGYEGDRKDPAQQQARLKEIVGTVIHAGGDAQDSRYQRFTEYAGRMIMHARLGDMSLGEAWEAVRKWMDASMSPPWDELRALNEFEAIARLDQKNHADAWARSAQPESKPVEVASTPSKDEWDLEAFRVEDMFPGTPPPIPFIIDEFLIENTVHALVADGGVGKTYMALDMAMRCAIGPGQNFLGFPVRQQAVCVVLTVEDTKDDLYRRIHAMDPHKELRQKMGGRFKVVPVRSEIRGGLTLMERDMRGNYKPSAAWLFLVEHIKKQRERFPGLPVVVVIDTYSATHHGNENESVGTNEWFRSAALLSAECEAAIVVTHHVRKADPNQEIKTVADFRALVRGSGAFTANCRAVYGIWEMPNQTPLKKESGCEPEATLFNFGLVKANIGLDWSARSNPKYPEPIVTLRRRGDGLLIYDAHIHETRLNSGAKAKQRTAAAMVQLRAAVLKAIELYAQAGYPLAAKNLSREFREFLPQEVHGVPGLRTVVEEMLPALVSSRVLIRVQVKGGGKTVDAFDVPTGAYALGETTRRSVVAPTVDWSAYHYDQDKEVYLGGAG